MSYQRIKSNRTTATLVKSDKQVKHFQIPLLSPESPPESSASRCSVESSRSSSFLSSSIQFGFSQGYMPRNLRAQVLLLVSCFISRRYGSSKLAYRLERRALHAVFWPCSSQACFPVKIPLSPIFYLFEGQSVRAISKPDFFVIPTLRIASQQTSIATCDQKSLFNSGVSQYLFYNLFPCY